MISIRLLLVSFAVALIAAGCASKPKQQETTKYTLANTERFVVLDPPSHYSIACTGLQERMIDGKLEVIANVRNLENRALKLQVQCVFRDAEGFPTGDDTTFRPLVLDRYETAAVRFQSATPQTRSYTIRVRQLREPAHRAP